MSAFLRDSLLEGAKQQEMKYRLLELNEKTWNPLDPDRNPFTSEIEEFGVPSYVVFDKEKMLSFQHEFEEFRPPAGASREEIAKLQKDWEKRKDHFEKFRQWGEEERKIFEEMKKAIEREAYANAQKKVPEVMDISLLGGGWSFLLEFSTIIVIIFALIILGILGTLEGREISAILAAIAGYVLGKATQARQSRKESANETES